MRRLLSLVALLGVFGGVAQAEMRPVPRPALSVEVLSTRGSTESPEVTAIATSVRPVVRLTRTLQRRLAMAKAIRAPEPVIDVEGLVRQSSRPLIRDPDLILAASRRPRQDTGGGGICGRGSIKGEVIAPVPGNGACGIPNAVRVTAVSGVTLSRAARMDCNTARALDDWVRNGVIPVVGRTGGGPVALNVAAGYACRTRNNLPGARVSEHGKGKAIDISGISLADGSDLTVLRDWRSSRGQRIMRELHRRACGPFGTVLGPASDRFHQDHFHFDTASYRSGPYCR